MKTKKLLGMLLALTMVFSMVIIPQAVVNADYSDNVLVESDFQGYTGGYSGITNKSGSGILVQGVSNKNQNQKLYAVTDETTGNTYMESNEARYQQAASTTSAMGDAGVQLKFDTEFASTGTYALSFDIGRKTAESTSASTFAVKMSSNDPRIMAAWIKEEMFYGYKTTGGTSYDREGTYGQPIPFEKNKIYRVDVVFDLDSKYDEESTEKGVVSAYINGQLLTRKGYTAGLAGKILQIRMEQSTPYFDNLKFAKIAADSFEATAEYANNTATISFTESLLTEETALDASDFTVTNAATGEAVAVATATKTAYDEVTLAFADGAIKKGFIYNVAFSSDVKNIAGNGVTGTASFALPAEEKTAYTEDFTDFTADEITIENYADLGYNSFRLLANEAWATNKTWEGYNPFKEVQSVSSDGTDSKAIRIIRGTRPTAADTFSDVAVKLPYKIYFEGDVAVEYRIKASSDLNSFIPYLIASKNAQSYQITGGSSIPSIRFDANAVKYSSVTYRHNGAYTTYASNVDADRENAAYHTYKAVYHFDNDTADIYFDGTKLNEEALPITNFFHTSGGAADGAPAYVKDYGYFDRIDMRINGANETSYVDIDYIKVTQTSVAPYVKGITYKDYQGNAAEATSAGIKEIAVSFGGNVSEASLENITILDGATPVKYEGAFDATTRTYTMTIPSLLAGEKTYALDLAAVADPYGAAIVGEKEFAIATAAGTKGDLTVTFSKAKAEISAGDKVEITATIIDTTGAAAENYALIGAVNNGGTLSDVDLVTLTWNGCVGTAKANVTVDSLTDVSVKAFVLESLGTLAPVAGSPFAIN